MTENEQAKKKLGGGMVMPNEKTSLIEFQRDLAKYALAVEFVKDKVVLDVACGCGYGSGFLFDNGAKLVTGGDISTEALAAAQKFYGRKGVQFFMVNATRLPFADNSFDVVVSIETIEHLEYQDDFLAECKRVLKDGGVFICSTPNRMTNPNQVNIHHPFHVHELTAVEFDELISGYFKDTKLYGHVYFHKGACCTNPFLQMMLGGKMEASGEGGRDGVQLD